MSNLILFGIAAIYISDNTGLLAARQSQKVVGVFCLDPNLRTGRCGTGESHIHDWLFAAATAALYTSR